MSATSLTQELRDLASVDLFKAGRKEDWHVGRPFALDFNTLRMVSNDKWKNRVGGLPAGAFLLCFYEGEPDIDEAILLRVLRPTPLPSDSDIVASMVEYYKEDIPTLGSSSHLDSYTRAEFQFSGLECRVLGSFYRGGSGDVYFAGDLDNFYAPNNYRVYKPSGKVLEYIVNYREEGVPGGQDEQRIGEVRYSSSRRHPVGESVPVYVSPNDFLKQRTALFGMTRTGKSNTVKKIIQATVSLASDSAARAKPLPAVGQIIFDINGEYANENQQDAGTALFAQYSQPGEVTRYSVMDKPGFKVLKLNFYSEISAGFGLLASLLADDTADYTRAFCSIDWEEPPSTDWGAKTRYARRVAAYQCCLARAGFTVPPGTVIRFESNQEIRQSGIHGLDGVDPKQGLSIDDAIAWFDAVWRHYRDAGGPFEQFKANNAGRDWAEEDLQTLMRFMTRRGRPGANVNASESGFIKLQPFRSLHTATLQQPFEAEILDRLRQGKIVIVDLSQGDPNVQRTYSDRICRAIFADAMDRFVQNQPTNVIQMYFEEAHNLFPRKEDPDLTNIYNRIAKEGAKLGLGLIYATQEVSSISSNVLKNTQNWFVSHLNNQDELREIRKYYDFDDFVDSLLRTTDKGFIRMKTFSNTFVVPVQIDKFTVGER